MALKFHPIAISAVIDPFNKENEGIFLEAPDFPSAEEMSTILEKIVDSFLYATDSLIIGSQWSEEEIAKRKDRDRVTIEIPESGVTLETKISEDGAQWSEETIEQCLMRHLSK